MESPRKISYTKGSCRKLGFPPLNRQNLRQWRIVQMKHWKKASALFLALVMALAIPAGAAD